MCPSTHNMDLIRSSCLMLVIKLKEKKRWGWGLRSPLQCPGDHKLASRAHRPCSLRATHAPKTPQCAWDCAQRSDFSAAGFSHPGRDLRTGWSSALGRHPPPRPRRTPPAPGLKDLHQRGRTGHLVPGTVVLSLNKTLASLQHRAAHILVHDVGAPVPGVKEREREATV